MARFDHELLARVRVDLGLTQEEAARAVGVDVRTYRRYESGEVNAGGDFAVHRASRRRMLQRIAAELGIAEEELLRSDDAPLAVVSLPRARHFVGRVAELEQITSWLDDPRSETRVAAVVAVGGAGKTSLIERALATRPPLRVFVHSFYEEPSVDAFFDGASRQLGGVTLAAERLERLLLALRRAPASVLVLDGVELVQASGERSRSRGEIEDPRLVRLFRSIVRDRALGRVLVTSRFPLVDLAAFEGAGLTTLALGRLAAGETTALLRRWGLRGGNAIFRDVHESTGGHALSVAVTGSFAEAFLDGDLERIGDLDLADAARDEPLARRLRALLAKYASELAPLDRDLLAIVSIFPRGIDIEGLRRIPRFAAIRPIALRTSMGRLVHRGLLVVVAGRLSAHAFIREHFRSFVTDAPQIHAALRDRAASLLEGQPTQRPEGTVLLDALETVFEHTLLAGAPRDAHAVLERTMGGFEHLGLRLGEFERGLRMTRALEATLEAPTPESLPTHARWRITYDRGLYSAAIGDLIGAVRAYERCLAIGGDDVTTHRTLAYTLRLRGDLAGAHDHVDRSLALARAEGATGAELRALALRGAIFTAAGRHAEARAAFSEAHARGGSPYGAPIDLGGGAPARERGGVTSSRSHAREPRYLRAEVMDGPRRALSSDPRSRRAPGRGCRRS